MKRSVLLIRVNANEELSRTHGAVDTVRAAFPEARIVALVTPQAEGLRRLQADARIAEVLVFPPDSEELAAKTVRGFRRFMARHNFAAAIACCGATPGLDYRRHLMSLLLCPGRKFLLDAHGRLAPLWSLAGGRVLAGVAAASFRRTLAERRKRYKARSDALNTEFTFAIRPGQSGDRGVIREVYEDDCYRVAALARAPRIVFDIGAHIGTFTVLLKQRFPAAQVFCFEPDSKSFELLQANTARLPGVHLFNQAIGYSGKAVLLESVGNSGGARLIQSDQSEAFRRAEGKVMDATLYRVAREGVPVRTVEEIFAATGVDTVDLAKWDCEGGEIDAFTHMSDEVAARFRDLVGEYHISGGFAAFHEITQRKFPHHRFSGEDAEHGLGWFRGEYLQSDSPATNEGQRSGEHDADDH